MLPLVVAFIMLLASVAFHSIASGVTLRVVPFSTHHKVTLTFWRGVTVMQVAALILMASHIIQVLMWAVPLFIVGDLGRPIDSLYFSMQNYTTLGYGDILMKDQWRILGPIEAAVGVLMFGLSTSVMFRVHSDVSQARARNSH